MFFITEIQQDRANPRRRAIFTYQNASRRTSEARKSLNSGPCQHFTSIVKTILETSLNKSIELYFTSLHD